MELLFLALIERTAAVEVVVVSSSSSRLVSLRASDSLTYNLTKVFTSTAYHALNDGVASNVDGDSDHQLTVSTYVR